MPRLPCTPEGFKRYLGSPLTAPSEIVSSWEELCRRHHLGKGTAEKIPRDSNDLKDGEADGRTKEV